MFRSHVTAHYNTQTGILLQANSTSRVRIALQQVDKLCYSSDLVRKTSLVVFKPSEHNNFFTYIVLNRFYVEFVRFTHFHSSQSKILKIKFYQFLNSVRHFRISSEQDPEWISYYFTTTSERIAFQLYDETSFVPQNSPLISCNRNSAGLLTL